MQGSALLADFGLTKIAQHMDSISGSSIASKERGTAKYRGSALFARFLTCAVRRSGPDDQ